MYITYTIVALIIIVKGAASETDVKSIPRLPRLVGGIDISTTDYRNNIYGAAAVGLIGNQTGFVCQGVLVAPHKFVTSTQCFNTIAPIVHVYVGSLYMGGLNSQFDGQSLNQTGPVHYDTTALLAEFTVSPIPPGSLAVEAVQYPRGSSPPPPGSECVALGYSNRNMTYDHARLNYVPAHIADYSNCAAAFNLSASNNGTQFCAFVLDPTSGNTSICAGDIATIIMCKGWARTKRVPDSERVRMCLFFPGSPFCKYVCSVSSNIWYFCNPDTEEDSDDQWYLAGILEVFNSHGSCNAGNDLHLFGYLPNQVFT